MKVNIAICLAIIVFIIKSVQNDESEEYVTYKMGSASSLMNWVNADGQLTFLDYYEPADLLISPKCEKSVCNSTKDVCLCDSIMICYQQSFKSCLKWISPIAYKSANATDNLFMAVVTLVLDDHSLKDIANYPGLLKNIKNLSITTYCNLNWTLTEKLLNRTEALISLSLVSFGTDDETITPEKVNLKGESLKNLTYVNIAGFHEMSHFSWLKDSEIKALRLNQLYNTDIDLLVPYLPNTIEDIDIGREISFYNGYCDLIKNVTHLPIKKLGLARLNLLTIPKTLKNISKTLQYLSLYGNDIEDLITKAFKELEVSKDDYEFPYLPELLELDLRNCGIQYLYKGMFKNMPKLRKLSIGSNKINFKLITEKDYFSKINLVYTDVSNNRNDPRYSLNVNEVYDTKTFKNYVNNPVYVDLSYSNRVVYNPFITENTTHLLISYSSMSCVKKKSSLSSLQVLYFNNLLIDSNCCKTLTDDFITAKDLKELHFMNSNIDDTDILNFISNFQQLNTLILRGNHIETITEQQINSLKNLEVLDLSCNNIMSWRKNILQKNSNLKELNVSSNKLTMISHEMLEDFKKIPKLDISKNPLICNEDLQNLVDIFNKQKFQLFYSKEKFCSAEGHYLNYYEYLNAISQITTINSTPITNNQVVALLTNTNEHYHVYLIVIIIILIAFSVSSVLIYFRRNTVSYYTTLIRITKGKILFKKSPNKSTKNFHYDVFVSYSENDREWVLQQLIPQLEKNGTHICLHERDFQVGMSILENIMDNMNRSRCLLLVISNSFIKSRWCQFEMNLAQFYRVEMRDRHIILVFLEQIEKTNRPKLLHYLMSTKTYLEWPQEKANKYDEERNRFFNRLSQALQYKRNTEEI